jgi:5-hydroxyisourate hydrolase-like protein (transthyretin family)
MARNWSRALLLSISAIALTASAQAQTPARVLTGTVFDSAAGVPLAGAVVQLVRLNEGDAAKATAAITNDRGRYRIDGVAPGRYLIGFQHEALNVFHVEAPARRVEVPATTTAADSSVVVDLAMPSVAELRAAVCDSTEQAGGLIAGRVVDGRTGAALEGAAVTVGWSELAIQGDTLRPRHAERTSRVRDDGTYLICGPSTEERLTLTVAKEQYFTLIGELTIPNAGVLRRDHLMAETARIVGTGRVSGRVARSDGALVSSARVAIPALALEQAVTNGRFSFSKVPRGRWLLDVRAIGFAPWEQVVEVDANAEDIGVAMTAVPPTLETQRVVASRYTRDELVIREIVERNRIGGGTMFLPGNPWLRDALFPVDVIRAAHGFRYTNPNKICARLGCIPGPPSLSCSLGGDEAPSVVRRNTIALYVDGERLRGGLMALNDLIPIKDVLAIETYPDIASAPFKFKSPDTCAVIAVWTRKNW